MFRSLFLLSLAAAPMAFAGTPAALDTASNVVASATPSDKVISTEADTVRAQVQDLKSNLDVVRGELAQLREQEDARTRVIGDPNDHALWP
ncbi:MAG TPA: hypothetical protein VFI53_10315 [Myxococcaceae bacterium]|nr:hypothetical protein [Myxococcaceae bacterium]